MQTTRTAAKSVSASLLEARYNRVATILACNLCCNSWSRWWWMWWWASGVKYIQLLERQTTTRAAYWPFKDPILLTDGKIVAACFIAYWPSYWCCAFNICSRASLSTLMLCFYTCSQIATNHFRHVSAHALTVCVTVFEIFEWTGKNCSPFDWHCCY